MRALRLAATTAAIIASLALPAAAGGSHNNHCDYKPWKCDTTTTTTTTPETTTTTTEETTTTTEEVTTTTAPEETTTTEPATTTTTGETTTTTEATTTTAARPVDFEPYWTCTAGATWIGADYQAPDFARIDIYLEEPGPEPESRLLAPGDTRFGVLEAGTYFTLVGLTWDGETTVTHTLNVPATDCSDDPAAQPTLVADPDPTDPTLPHTGASGDLGLAGGAALAVGGALLLATRLRRPQE